MHEKLVNPLDTSKDILLEMTGIMDDWLGNVICMRLCSSFINIPYIFS